MLAQGDGTWRSSPSSNNRWKFVLTDGNLEVTDTTTNNTQVKLLNWQPGDYGIHKIDPRPNPVTTRTFTGDRKDADFDPVNEGIQTQPDGLGNTLRADGQGGRANIEEANREDVFYGSVAAGENAGSAIHL